jgi:hypothetical protein
LRFFDWLIRLPEAAELKLEREVDAARGAKRMPYITSWERMGVKRGRKEGLLKAITRQLRRKLGRLDAQMKAQLERLSAARLEQLSEALLDFSQPDDLERWLKRKAT